MKQFYFARLFFGALLLSLSFNLSAQYTNVSCTGYNNDIIANDGSATSNTATSGTVPGVTYPDVWVDGNLPVAYGFIGSDYKWWSGGPAASCGLVSNGNYPSGTTPGLVYTIQSSTANNSLTIISNSYSGSVLPTTGTFTLTTPAKFSKLFILYETVINTAGPSITATITFTDLSTQVISGNNVVNWFSAGISGYAGVMQRAGNAAPANPTACQTTGPRLFEMPLSIDPANYNKLVQSITFDWSTPTGTAVNLVDYFHGMAVAGLGPCTTPPTAGTVTSSANPVCAGTTINLNVTGGTGGTGQTYQWQYSADSINWTSNPADTLSYLQTTQTATTFYRLIVSCSGMSDTTVGYKELSPALIAGGSFTINASVPTGGTNFQNFGDAINYIKCGIGGPVTFNVAPGSGPYQEQVSIPAIYGTSATNRIIFRGNGETLKFASADGSNRHVLKLDGADYVTIDNFVIDATGGTYGWGMHFINGADYDSVKNCTINCDLTSISTNYSGIVMSGSVTSATVSGNTANNTVIIGNTINGGYYGIINYGTTAIPFPTAVQFINNVVNDFYYYGIYTYGATNALISGNTVERLSRSNQGITYAIYLGTYTSDAVVTKNQVVHLYDFNNASTSSAYCIYVGGDAVAGSQNLISNNLISDINHNGTIYGIYNTGAANMKAYHNTFSLDNAAATAGTTYGFYQTGSDTGMVFENNLVTITRGGTGSKYGIYMSTSNTPLISNYNDIYINSAGSGTQAFGYNVSARATLADWQTATGFDFNSLSIDPVYTAPGSDYKPTATTLNDKGTGVGVTTDILGMPRNLSHPDMGAYEFNGAVCVAPPVAGDAATPTATVCSGSSVSLQLLNNSVGAGQTYQWATSTSSSGPWTPLGGTLNVSDTTIIVTNNLWYHAAVTCGTSTAISNPVSINVTQPLSGGTYTINAAVPTGATNFNSFTDVSNAIKCGITGPVVLNVVAGSGPYTEQFSLPALSGSSPVNRVTINGNGETIKFASSDANSRHVVLLNGADYVTIKNLTVDATGGTYGFGIVLTNQANNDSIVNCTVNCDMTATTTNFACIAITGTTTAADGAGISASNTVVMNCTTNGGYYGITNNGPTSGPYISNNQIIHNTVNDFYSYGIYNYGSVDAIISQNTIQRLGRTNTGTMYGIYVNSYCTGALVEKNKVTHLFDAVTTSTSAAYCFYMAADATAASPNIVVNNLVSDINHNGSIYALYNSGGRYTKYYHNTISLDNASATAGSAYGIYQSTLDTGIIYLNNIITITRGGSGTKYGIYKSSLSSPVLVCDYNNIYVNSSGTGSQGVGYNGTLRVTLADWQLATALDSNSKSIDPLYVAGSSGDYHPSEATLDNAATPIGVLTDIENVTRSTTNPDMGAYEFGQISPVRLVHFSVAKEHTAALLKWTTSSEVNLDHYEIERSADGANFNRLGTVVSKAVNGNSSTALNYNYADPRPFIGTTYYRLKQVDKDGNFTYSNIVKINGVIDGGLTVNSIYPNPAKSKVNIVLNAPGNNHLSFTISDVAGRIVMQQSLDVQTGENRLTLDIAHVKAGAYLLKVFCHNGCETLIGKIVKQ